LAKRIFELAREVGVTSKAVLEKCRAEGLEVKNHMTALSAGLEATISEWFSEAAGGVGTAVETTEHVDLDKAHKKAEAQRRRRKKKAAEKKAAEQEPADEAPVETLVAEIEPEAEAEAPEVVEEVQQAVAEVEAPEAPEVPEAPPEAEETVEKPQEPELPEVVPNEPVIPEVIAPAGPQVVPAPAKLQGPRVVRFDGVETSPAPRPARRRPRPRPVTDLAAEAAAAAAAGPAKGKKRGRTGTAAGGDKTKRPQRRSPRRKSGGESGEGLREWRDRDLMERSARLAAAAGGTLRRHRASVGPGQTEPRLGGPGGEVEISEPITVKSLSAATGIRSNNIIRKLMGEGILATINQTLDREMAQSIASDNGIELNVKIAKTAENLLEEEFAQRKKGQTEPRAPVVTFLGHVDHGKTSLLDHIRNAAVAEKEDGGITQGFGSYRYDIGGKSVVFLDTPGHEAFTAMRARGADMTDIVVLVVAADDGVMPQTIEAINHAKAAEVPIVVALNKIDLPNANIQRAMGQLAEHDLQPREWGGQTEVIQTSATTGEGIDKLVEILTLEAELLELTAEPNAPASGWVTEALRDPARGVLASLLVKNGTLKVGDVVLCGGAAGRVRNILDDNGKPIKQAPPATPVEIIGLDEVPDAGDRFYVVDDLTRAKDVAHERRQEQRAKSLAATPQTTLENLFDRIEAGASSEVKLIVKADVQGSIEALLGSLRKVEIEEVKVTVLHSGVGGITEGDVLLAEASEAIVLGFRVTADSRSRSLAEQEGVEIRTYRVIYQLIEDIEQAVRGMLTPETVEKVTGRADVREVFKISRVGTIAGCYVTDGLINRNAAIRITRDNIVVVDERKLESLRRVKDDVREVRAGLECGLRIADFNDVKVGDVIEAYQTVEVAPGSSAGRLSSGTE
jgi:translation initiation factor IF-2